MEIRKEKCGLSMRCLSLGLSAGSDKAERGVLSKRPHIFKKELPILDVDLGHVWYL